MKSSFSNLGYKIVCQKADKLVNASRHLDLMSNFLKTWQQNIGLTTTMCFICETLASVLEQDRKKPYQSHFEGFNEK